MTRGNQTYKTLLLIVILIFGIATLYGLKTNEPPRLILFIGRFHPLLLHLPIGALIVTFFIDVLGRIQNKYPDNTIKNLLGFTGLFSVLTCFLGYFLSLEGGYNNNTLDIHLYTGIGTALLINILYFISLKPNFKANKLFLALFITSLITISIAGHYGSILTHGDNFLTEYAKAPEKENTIEIIDSLRMYDDVIAKILDDKCVQCHNTSKQKGELSLISPTAILNGGVSGPIINEGNAINSLLFSRTQLAISNEEHMPPEGKKQLTKDEIWLIEHWINNGIDFKQYASSISENDSLKAKLKNYLIFDKIKIPKASKDAIEIAKSAGFRVLELVPGEAELNVKLLDAKPTKETFEALESIEEQIVELELNATAFNDNMSTILKNFKNLKQLRLDKTLITDKTLGYVKYLDQLEVLNLFQTDVTNKGISDLLVSIQPKTIYAWETGLDQQTAETLIKNHNIDIQYRIAEGLMNSQLEMPFINTNRTIFVDTIHVDIKSRLKEIDIRYTLNGDAPTIKSPVFDKTLVLDDSKILKARVFKNNWKPSEPLVINYAKILKKITDFAVTQKPDENYSDESKLFDLTEGSTDFRDGNWVGYFGENLSASIDLGASKKVNNITISALEDIGSWILYPTNINIYMSNTKNGKFRKIGDLKIERVNKDTNLRKQKFTITMPEITGRFFKIEIKNHKELPSWHPSAGNPSWIFVDEIYFW
jgi:uncharacterized membrane protein